MQFLMYSVGPNTAPPPTPEKMAELGKLTEDTMKAGALVTTGGVQAQGPRVKLSGGKYTVTDGPYIEAKELMGGFAVLRLKSLDEAIAWAKRFRDIVGDGESEIVTIMEPGDFGQD